MNLKMRDLLSIAGLTALFAAVTLAQAPAKPPATLRITATSANVSGAGEKVEFFINRWSADADLDKLVAAWNPKRVAPPAAGAGRAGGAEGAPARRGGGGGGRGGRGGDAAAAPRTPEAALAATLKDLPAAGYFWTSEVGGYVIKYAARIPDAAGGSRIIMLTDKRLGAAKNGWQPVPEAKTNTFEFSLLELRLPAKGDGEGKASLTGTITLNPDTKNIGLEGYDALPVTLRGVQARSES